VCTWCCGCVKAGSQLQLCSSFCRSGGEGRRVGVPVCLSVRPYVSEGLYKHRVSVCLCASLYIYTCVIGRCMEVCVWLSECAFGIIFLFVCVYASVSVICSSVCLCVSECPMCAFVGMCGVTCPLPPPSCFCGADLTCPSESGKVTMSVASALSPNLPVCWRKLNLLGTIWSS
jgi:hypothetical protein